MRDKMRSKPKGGKVGSTISGQRIFSFYQWEKEGRRDGSAETGQSASHALIYGQSGWASQDDPIVAECNSAAVQWCSGATVAARILL